MEPKFIAGEQTVVPSISVDVNPDDDIAVGTLENVRVRDEAGEFVEKITVTEPVGGLAAGEYFVRFDNDGNGFIDVDGDDERDGASVTNIISDVVSGKGFPDIDWALIASLSALVAISGSGGLSNTPISNYTRDEGWGMGHHVGAIPSVVGGLEISLSHQGTVFNPDAPGAMPRWRRWFKHVMRDQLVV